ncbi:MAG TPA: hypothetical protein VN478_02675 [Clostridia bacterium]|nr:hypothetical protein [Clostridia bacterium]
MKRTVTGLRLQDLRIRRSQYRAAADAVHVDRKRLIVFLVPGWDGVNGGILSIVSLCAESRKLCANRNADVFLVSSPGDPPLMGYTKFANREPILDLTDVVQRHRSLDYLLIHVPECYVAQFAASAGWRFRARLLRIRNVRFNVMLQNIDLLPDSQSLKRLASLGVLTITTAHEQYTSREMRQGLGFPLHHLSTFVSPGQYVRVPLTDKENLLVLSPDPSDQRGRILGLLHERLPEMELVTVQGMKYEDYKSLLQRARWSLTFGEGLDGYFVETVFSGGIAFAVYNSRFFTGDFHVLRTVYESWDELAGRICDDIGDLGVSSSYEAYQKAEYALCAKHYDHSVYLDNLRKFYAGEYSYP